MAENNPVLQFVTHNQLVPNPNNPRKTFANLETTKKSIIAQGIIQPLLVRPQGKKFEIVAGECRWLATGEAIEEGALPKKFEMPIIAKDLNDDEVQQYMLIENIIREPLSDYEQAVAFKDFIDRHPDLDAIGELALKTGLNVQYVRRKAKVIEHPASVLALWQAGKLSFGHLEQLLRIDAADVEEVAKSAFENGWSISELKRRIERQNSVLSDAIFDTKEAGCTKCQFSTKVQKALFGGDDFKAEKVMCTKVKCFMEKQKAALADNWQKLPDVKKAGTNGILTSDEGITGVINYNPKEDCKECKDFVTVLSGDLDVDYPHACKGDVQCFNAKYPSYSRSSAATTPEEKAEKRTENIGKECAEEFFARMLPEKIRTSATYASSIVILMTLAKGHPNVLSKMLKDRGVEIPSWGVSDHFIKMIDGMDQHEIYDWISDFSSAILLSTVFTLDARKKIAEMVDLRLDRDFVITEFYLKKKNKEQLIELGTKKFDVIKSQTAKELAQFKKTAIISLILEKDLSGMIPDEILAVAAGKSETDDVVDAEFKGDDGGDIVDPIMEE